MMRIEGLRKNFGNVEALRGIGFEVLKGELYGFLGPNGAGKTTTVKLLTGLAKPDAGTATLDGRDIFKTDTAARRRVGVVHQHSSLDLDLTIRENLFIHSLYYEIPRAEFRKRLEEILDFTDLRGRADDRVRGFSGGMKRRLMIGRALMHRPDVIFLDEPTAGLDPTIRRKVWSLIKAAQRDGATLFLTTHYIEEAEFLCDRVAFIDNGAILTIDTPENLKNSLGRWAVDIFEGTDMRTKFFADRRSAENFILSSDRPMNIRRVNLEDAFISLTGRAIGVDPPAAANHNSSPAPL